MTRTRLLYSYFNLNDEADGAEPRLGGGGFCAGGRERDTNITERMTCIARDMDAFRSKMRRTFLRMTRPDSVQVHGGEITRRAAYSEATPAISSLSTAAPDTVHLQTIGEAPYTTLYFTLDY